MAREWRGSADDKDRWWPYFEAIIKAVDQIHHDPVLVRFWRRGELVANRSRAHPFNDRIPEKWRNEDRWFNLDTSVDPTGAWTLQTELPVMAVARVLGKPGQREWLIYVQATRTAQKGVEITVPGYQKVRVDTVLAGSYFWVREADGSVTEVGR